MEGEPSHVDHIHNVAQRSRYTRQVSPSLVSFSFYFFYFFGLVVNPGLCDGASLA